ncbi:hypothetical protein, partial [Blastococcus atacamensis]|uniref:hypothetical protein n=1 Tax=Blastococcus atacamensis TaxID=2070508 RepID=UPI001E64E160
FFTFLLLCFVFFVFCVCTYDHHALPRALRRQRQVCIRDGGAGAPPGRAPTGTGGSGRREREPCGARSAGGAPSRTSRRPDRSRSRVVG